jgi:hypothetical protein
MFFYDSKPLSESALKPLEEVIRTEPATVEWPAELAAAKAAEIAQSSKGKFLWHRLIFAVVLLIALLIAAIYTAMDPRLAELYTMLIHSFELILGAIVGLLTGESIAGK